MSTFDRALAFVLAREGGYVNDPDDPGGATNLGITQRTYDNHRAQLGMPLRNVRNLGLEEAADIYRMYWLRGRCSRLPAAIAFAHFDACVNHGVAAAARLLQAALGVEVDGVIGKNTVEAAGKRKPEEVVLQMISRREALYDAIVENSPSQAKFRKGWHNRLVLLEEAAL